MFSQYKGTCPYLTLIIVPTNPKVNLPLSFCLLRMQRTNQIVGSNATQIQCLNLCLQQPLIPSESTKHRHQVHGVHGTSRLSIRGQIGFSRAVSPGQEMDSMGRIKHRETYKRNPLYVFMLKTLEINIQMGRSQIQAMSQQFLRDTVNMWSGQNKQQTLGYTVNIRFTANMFLHLLYTVALLQTPQKHKQIILNEK